MKIRLNTHSLLSTALAITASVLCMVSAEAQSSSVKEVSLEETVTPESHEPEPVTADSEVIAESEEQNSQDRDGDESPLQFEKTLTEDESTPLPTFERDPLANIAGAEGAYSINEFTGELRYSYRISAPPGRNGLTPSVALNYSSSNKDTRSIVGAAWQLDIPKIERYSRTGIEDRYVNHNFTSALVGGNGELTPQAINGVGYGTYLPKVWSRKTHHEFIADGSWQVIDAEGTVYTFGNSSETREQSLDGTRVHTWFLSMVQDTNGNTIQYEYTKSQGAVYLIRILYGSAQVPYEIRFEPYYSEGVIQLGTLPSYAKGFPVNEDRDLLQSIEVLDPVSSDKLVYELTYAEQGGIEYDGEWYGQLPFLQTIQQRGISSTLGTADLPPTIFEYAPYDGSRSYAIEIPQLSTDDFYDNLYFNRTTTPLWLFGDHNGDGWTDLITDVALPEQLPNGSWRAAPYERVILNMGNGQWTEGVKDPTPYDWAWEYRPGNGEVRNYRPPAYMDFEGDFSESLCVRHHIYLNLLCQESSFTTQPSISDTFRYLDYNGDSLTDVILLGKRVPYESLGNTLWENTGGGFAHLNDGAWRAPNDMYYDEGTLFADINGDGSDDFVHSFVFTPVGIPEGVLRTERVLLSTPDGWLDVTADLNIPVPLFDIQYTQCTSCSEPGKCGNCYNFPATITARFLDVNRDGLPDIVRNGFVYLNNGAGWDSEYFLVEWRPGRLPHIYEQGDQQDIEVSFLDLNADGILERRFTNLNLPHGTPSTQFRSHLPDTPVLVGITMPQGGNVDFEYTPASGYTNADGSAANIELPVPRLTLSQAISDDGFGAESVTSYAYVGGKLHRPHVQEQEFLGFREVERIQSDGSIVELEFLQGDVTSNFAEKGRLRSERVLSAAGTVLREVQHLYVVEERETGSFQALEETAVKISSSEADASVRRATASEFSYDQYGNLVVEIDYGEVEPNSSFGEFSDLGLDKIERRVEYAENAEAHILSLPQHEERRDSSGDLVAETRVYYDYLPFGQVSFGNVTQKERLLEASDVYLTTSTEYNSVGLPTKVTNPRGFQTTVEYDSYDLFPIAVTNAKDQVTQYEFNSLFAAPSVVTDPNGGRSVTVLDPLGRLVETRVSDPSNPSQEVPATSRTYDTESFPNSVTTVVYTGNAGIETVGRTYFDGFGRPIQNRQETEGVDQYTVTSTLYDERGNVAKELLPVFGNGLDFEAINLAALGTAYSYDALDRITVISTPVGTTSTLYDAWTQVLEDANGHRKALEYDARGNLAKVTEHLDGMPFSTHYAYDALNNLTQITDARGNFRRMTYDLQGRKLTEEDLHTAGDSTFGVWSFTYDANGNLTARNDPKGQTVVYTYDELNRVLAEDASTEPGVEVGYGYDEGSYGIGRLTSVTAPAVTKQFMYDVLGRLVREQKIIDSSAYVTSFTYDLTGNPLSITYPDGMVVGYGYDNAGQLASLQRDGASVVENLDYAAPGLVSRIDFANGVSTVNTYDPAQMYRLTHKVTTGPNWNAWQDISYVFDPVGNIMQISETSATAAAKTAVYGYDDLDRLLTATVSATPNGADYTRTYAYDILGNILSRSDVGTYSYAGGDDGTSSGTPANPHAVTNVAGSVYSYDANGNLTSNGIWTHSWDYRDRLVSSTDGSTTIAYAYDEDGTRALKKNVVSRKRTVYVSQYYDIEDGTAKRHIYAGNLKVASDTVAGGAGTHPSCRPPAEGDWLVTNSCTFTGQAVAPADVVVDPGAVLTVSADAILEIDLRNQKLLVKQEGGGILIKKSGAVRQSSGTILISVGYAGLVYHHDDHLSGSNVDTDENGGLLEVADYYPFGAVRLDEQLAEYENDYKFTGKELDENTGLYYYEARYYDARIGRFVSIDPWFGDVADPQSFNKYAYVRNNPLKYVDVNGRIPVLAAAFIAIPAVLFSEPDPAFAPAPSDQPGNIEELTAEYSRAKQGNNMLSTSDKIIIVGAATVTAGPYGFIGAMQLVSTPDVARTIYRCASSDCSNKEAVEAGLEFAPGPFDMIPSRYISGPVERTFIDVYAEGYGEFTEFVGSRLVSEDASLNEPPDWLGDINHIDPEAIRRGLLRREEIKKKKGIQRANERGNWKKQ